MDLSTTPQQTIAKNFGSLVGSQFVTWGLTLLLTVFLSRYLGAAGMGKLHLAESLWAITAIVMNFGMDTLLVKEVARKQAAASELLRATLRVRLLLGLAGFGVLALYVYFAGYPLQTVYVVSIIGIAGFISQFGEACRAVLQGLERMEYIAVAAMASKAFVTFTSIVLLLLGHGVVVIAAVTIGAALIYLSTQLFQLSRLQKLELQRNNDFRVSLVKSSFPFFMMSILLAAYQQADTIIISLLVDEAAVGWYGAAAKLFGAFVFIPALFGAAVFPALSRMHAVSSRPDPSLLRKSFALLFIVGVPIGLGLVVIADPLVVLLFGDGFAKSGPVLAVMGLAMIFTYQNILLAQFLISTDRQYGLTLMAGVSLLATVLLDLVLVPWCQKTFDNGAVGGALSYVITEAGIFTGCLMLSPKGTFGYDQARQSAPALFVGSIMAIATWFLRGFFIAIPIAFGAVIYVGLLVLFRLVPQEDWQMLKQLANSALASVSNRKPANKFPGMGGRRP
jgi:O-antigen/teichoic acid export membrane protein